MRLALPTAGLLGYKSASQKARVATEAWAASQLYCVNCASPEIESLPRNTPAHDFACPACRAPYQLKSQSKPIGNRIMDAEHGQMCRAIREDRTPNLFVMSYDSPAWRVHTLILIPRFAFSLAAIERRPALGPHARRAGWVGCNILLAQIPTDARVVLVEDGKPVDAKLVRRQYKRVKPLAAIEPGKRGWTLDVLSAVRSLGKQSFNLEEVYSLEPELARLHPDNRHVREKIRQQLQILRDARLLDFLAPGHYRLRT